MNKRIFRLLVMTLCIACMLSAAGAGAWADGPIDTDADVSLTVSFEILKKGIPGVVVSVYRVADVDEWAEFALCGGFKGYTGAINGWRTAAEWDNAAGKLASYATDPKNKISAVSKAATDNTGCVTFTNRITPGLYLLVFSETKYGGISYTAKSCLVCLPGLDDDEEMITDVLVAAKAGPVPTPPPPTPTPPPYLPQTGQLWWPVPVLLCAGLFFILIGVVRRRSGNDEEA